jgi:cell division protein FtsI (penicillin-binding protein 3)
MTQRQPPLAALLSGAPRPAPAPALRDEADIGRAEWRLALVAFAFVLGFSAVALRMAGLAVVGPSEPRMAASDAAAPAGRAEIVDRTGRPLAMNLPAWSVYAHPHEMDDPDRAAERLAGALEGVSAETLKARFAGGRTFAWVKRPISPDERQAVHDLGLPGVYFGEREIRLYPAGRVAAHVLGGARAGGEGVRHAEIVGLSGVERFHDAALRDPARADRPLKLTLDLPAQAALTEALRAGVERFNAIGAAGVLLDANTGAVVAMASLPDYDPNHPPNPNDPTGGAYRPMMNRVAEGVFELGSTFKPLFAALAIEKGLVGPETLVDTRAPLVWGRHRIRDFSRLPDTMTVTDVIARSSNVGTARLALMAGTPAAQEYLRKLGFFEATGLEIAEAPLGRPLLPPRWSDLSTITISFGHGLSATQLHLAAAYATLVNGGLRVRPTLDPDAPPPTEADRVLSTRTSMMMREILRRTVVKGTGKAAEAPGYEVGGKTGTADKPVAGGYARDKVLATFAAVFPSSNPQYVLVVTLDEPEDRSGPVVRRTAGAVAAPVAGDAIRRLAPLLGLRPAPPPPPETGPAVTVAARE